MDYLQFNLMESAKSGNIKFIEKIPTSELNASSIFNLIKSAEDKNRKVISNIILNRAENHENEVKAMKLSFIQNNIPVAWIILNTWPQPLERIDVSNCHLDQFPSIPSSVSSHLKEIDISGNNIDILNISLMKFPNLKQVNLDGNPLSIYPERCRSSWAKMKEYLQSIESRAEIRNVKKLLIVGEEGVGKSTLLKCLRKKTNKTNISENISTDGIDISDITLTPSNDDGTSKPVILKSWDFGGQEVYYASHQFFLTSRAIYILCFNLASMNIQRISYWIQQIQSMCKISNNDQHHTIENSTSSSYPPIFLVGTHLDDKVCLNNNNYIDEQIEEVQKLFKKFRYQGIYRIFSVSCKSGRGIAELKDSLYQISSESVRSRGNIHPSWILFLDYLQRTKESGISYLEWPKYEQIALKFKLQGSVLLTCTNFLMDIGVILHFRLSEKNYESELVILDPKWLSDLMMCFFTTQTTFVKNGILQPLDIPTALRNYRPYLHQSLITLLSKFEVIYQMSSGEFLIPNLLPNLFPEKQVNLVWKSILASNELEQGRVYKFDFLPLGFISRVIVRLLNIKMIEGILFWRNGAILSITPTNQFAKIIFDEQSLTLTINVRIPNYSNLHNQQNHQKNFDEIHEIQNKGENNGYIVCAPKVMSEETKRQSMLFMLLRLIIDEIEMLLECFYPRLIDHTNRFVLCSHCLTIQQKRNSNKKHLFKPSLFKVEDIMNAVTNADYFVFCNSIISPSRMIKIEDLAPDLCFADLPKINPLHLQLLDELGEGSFGIIYRGLWNGFHVAVKTVKDSIVGVDRSKFWEFQQECFLMSNLDHPNLVNLYGVTIRPMRMVMELVKYGDLYDLIHPPDPDDKRNRLQADITKYSWKYRMRIALDVAKGMQYLQNIHPPILHRDLRSPNIFIESLSEDADVVAKVADFGLSRSISSNVAGTLSSWQWLAPEVISESCEYGLKSDVYSFGIVLWELITFQHPFDEYIGIPKLTRILKDGTGNEFKMLNPNEVKHSIIFENLRPILPNHCPENLKLMIEQCWNSDPDKRPTFDEIVFILSTEIDILSNHQFFKNSTLFGSTIFQRRIRSTVASPPSHLLNNAKNNLNIDDGDNNNATLISIEEKPNFGQSITFSLILCFEKYFNANQFSNNSSDYHNHNHNNRHHDQDNHNCNEKVFTHLITDNLENIWAADDRASLYIIPSKSDNAELILLASKADLKINCMLIIGKQLWINYSDGNIVIICVESKMVKSTSVLKIDGKPMKAMIKVLRFIDEITPQITVWAISRVEKLLFICDACSWELIKTINLPSIAQSIVKCADNIVWIGLENGEILSFDSSSFELIGSWTAHNTAVVCLFYHRNVVWSGDNSGEISTWRLSDNNVSLIRVNNVHFDTITSIVLIGDYICTASADQSLVIWHFLSGEAKQEISDFEGEILSMISIGSSVICSVNDHRNALHFFNYLLPIRVGFHYQKEDKYDYLLDDENAKNRVGRKSFIKTVSIGLIRKRSPSTPNTHLLQNSSPTSRHSIDHQLSVVSKTSSDSSLDFDNHSSSSSSSPSSVRNKKKFRLFGKK